MTDEEYIRKAVNLAKGWKHERFGDQRFVEIPNIVDRYAIWNLPPQIKDALAAQLVRQVDALGEPCFFSSDAMKWSIVGSRDGTRVHYGNTDSRTMNTIKAIIDSGVLDGP